MKRLAALAVALTLGVSCCQVMSAPTADARGPARNPKCVGFPRCQ